MTIQEAKDKIAIKYGYPDWNMNFFKSSHLVWPKEIDKMINEVAELYHKSQRNL